MKSSKPIKFFIETYGCQMNFAESDSLRILLEKYGHIEVHSPLLADVAILNTCSVRTTAETRIVGRVGFYRGLNKKHKKKINVILMGCMAQNIGDEIKTKFPDVVKLVWGTYNKEGILPLMNDLSHSEDFLAMSDFKFIPAEAQKKYPFKAFVPISHGCNNFCTYCIVPHVRGREVHRKSVDIVDNIKRLVDEGVVEICLLGQNVNSYVDGNKHFPELLVDVADIDGVECLTYMTSHPKDFSRKLVDVMKSHKNIMQHIHLPFQAGSERILKMMNRKYTSDDYLAKIEIARTIPNIVLTTDIMVGFPTESDEDFADTMRIVETVRFNEAFMYRYNTRPGTIAAKHKDQIPEKIKLQRLNRLINTQNTITKEILPTHIGKTYRTLAESVSKKDPAQLTGCTHNGVMVFFKASEKFIGKIIDVKIVGVAGVGLKGEYFS